MFFLLVKVKDELSALFLSSKVLGEAFFIKIDLQNGLTFFITIYKDPTAAICKISTY